MKWNNKEHILFDINLHIHTVFYSVVNMLRFVKQKLEIPVRNSYNHIFLDGDSGCAQKRHSDLLPNNARCIIAGPLGCGKTNVLISLIVGENGLSFENIYIYCKTLDQDKYKYLSEIVRGVKGVGFYTFSSSQDHCTS